MTYLARIVTALAVLAVATPALPCSEHEAKTTTASNEKPAASGKVAKSGKKAKQATKPAAETQPVTASTN
jgi:DMSO/TMAO reductase YedYZ molybdopterin-dependent catalytic subunit